jgi:hypothetical protein
MYYLVVAFMWMTMAPDVIFEFNKNANVQAWRIVDDVVMGGRSSGHFSLTADGYGEFKGIVSLENNGGFSSVRYRLDQKPVAHYKKVVLKLKGDGKKYQFRVKANSGDYYSYITTFTTSGEWQEITIPLKDLYPSFRGQKLDMPNFNNDYISEIAFLIANYRNESFELLISDITLK